MANDARSADTTFNREAARLLRDTAELLAQQQANPFRVNAYRRAAETLESLTADARELLREEGQAGLIRLPFIGRGLATSIEQIARTGRLPQLDRLRGTLEPERLFQSVPGIGPKLAQTIHDALHVDTLEGLELAAHEGRLTDLPGIGPRRAAAIQASLASLLRRPGPARPSPENRFPDLAVVLDVDAEYRDKAAGGRLPTVAPRRFNPEGTAWLPVLHTDRGDWHFTALFSNTAKAHELGRTHDWVVTYYYDGDHHEGQNTIVTETRGPLKGKRVVRGREAECAAHYRRTG
jgi:putative hydrolase